MLVVSLLLVMGCPMPPDSPNAMGLADVDAACTRGDSVSCERMRAAYEDAKKHTAGFMEYWNDFDKLITQYDSRACEAGSRDSCLRLFPSGKPDARVYGILCKHDIATNDKENLVVDCYGASRNSDSETVRSDDSALDEVGRVCDATAWGNGTGVAACRDAATLLGDREPERRFHFLTKACNRPSHDPQTGQGTYWEDSCTALGEMYENGIVANRDATSALASYDRGCFKRRHEAPSAGCAKALDLRIHLCDGGEMSACTTLSDNYRSVDPLRAKALLGRACDAKYAPACKALDAWLGSGAADVRPK